jgi:hypothetical protein
MKKQPSRLKSAGSSQKRRQRKVFASSRSQSCPSYPGMEIGKTLRVSHIPTPRAATTDKCLTRRSTNIPLATKHRSGQRECLGSIGRPWTDACGFYSQILIKPFDGALKCIDLIFALAPSVAFLRVIVSVYRVALCA